MYLEPLTTILYKDGSVGQHEISLVHTKGFRSVPIGKTGYTRSKRTAQCGPHQYWVFNAVGKHINTFLSVGAANNFAKHA